MIRLSRGGYLSEFPAINDIIAVEAAWPKIPFVGRVAEIDLPSQTVTVDARPIPRPGGLKLPILSLAPGVGTKFHVSNFHHFIDDIGAVLRDSDLFEHRNDALGLRIVAPWPGWIRRLLWRVMGVHIHREKCCVCHRVAKKITAKGHGLCDNHKWFTGAALHGRESREYSKMNIRERAAKKV